ncbi:Solute carrier family 28 member 3 [Paramuricea clavata]|uniref:Solute carrier family 28 member 3 n=1 Tax=Paramuricea clavata TaxID=317549 RepID=A0A6S7FV81_PARCT|nr:Solute carrier family 28 member 3 [Paramuricea clavata]
MPVSLNVGDLSEPEETTELKAPEQIESDPCEKKKSHKHELGTLWNRIIVRHSPHSSTLWLKYKKVILTFLLLIALSVYCVFGIMISGFEKAKDLFGVLVFSGIIVVYIVIRDTFGKQINALVIKPVSKMIEEHWSILRWFIYGTLLVLILLWLLLDTIKDAKRLQSVAGLLVFVFLAYLVSTNRRKITWRPVLWGLALQFIFGILILRTKEGYDVMKYIGDKVTTFLDFTVAGIVFVFGEKYFLHFVAFKVLMVVIFFSSVTSVLYYLGVMQVIIIKLAWLMQVTLRVSGVEALCAAANVFVGLVEAPLLIGPFVKNVTMSELHAIMTSGLATIAGGMLAAYISLGIDANHVLSASVMSAPAALAISKLMYPETEVPATSGVHAIQFQKRNEKNVIEAAAQGASIAIGLVANIGANLIAFFAFLSFINAILSYLGGLVLYPELSFELICSYIFAPFALLMGVEWSDCTKVAKLLGIKTFLNEFLAFGQLSVFINNRKTMSTGPVLSLRSETIAVYVLTGFTNFLSVGIFLGGYGQLAPNRKTDMARIAIRGLIAATLACMVTACVAGN